MELNTGGSGRGRDIVLRLLAPGIPLQPPGPAQHPLLARPGVQHSTNWCCLLAGACADQCGVCRLA